ncbi:MAG TPA: putative Ig domain-containing protein [Pyrinomonadaceae bacterium]
MACLLVLFGTLSKMEKVKAALEAANPVEPSSLVAGKGTTALAGLTIVTQQRRFLDGIQGAPWGPVFLKANGGTQPYAWTVISGALPPGISLSTADGRLEGKPSAVGYYDFTVKVNDNFGQIATSAYRIRISTLTQVQQPPLKSSELPFNYVQSALFVGTGQNGGSQSLDELKALIRMNQKKFAGGEVFLTRLEDATDFQAARKVNQAIAEVRAEAGGKDFIGIFTNGRFPNFSEQADFRLQPDYYRAVSLKSNGSLWIRQPFASTSPDSLFGIEGVAVDITNDEAVKAMMDSLFAAFDHEGLSNQSVGPLNGFYVFNESRLSPVYMPFTQASAPPDNDDLVPKSALPLRPNCPSYLTQNPPLLRGGDPCVTSDFLAGPKRAVPLFSVTAKDKFVQYAAAHGVSISYLPADRNEFNNNDFEISLPSYVQFVPLTDTTVWNTWKAWVYETWSAHLEKIAQTITFAQAGNPSFRGVLYFQLPGIYSFTSPAKNEAFDYKYVDASGITRTVVGAKLSNFSKFDLYNNPVHGNDIEALLKSPWIQGFVHETTSWLMGVGGAPDRTADRTMLTTPEAIFLWNQEAAKAKLIARKYNKFFGLFARYSYFTTGDEVWVDDAIPTGGSVAGVVDSWSNRVGSNPLPITGTLSYQSAISGGMHQLCFWNSPQKLQVQLGDTLFAYVYVDPSNPPREVMLQWYSDDAEQWEHRAFWGEDIIQWGQSGTKSRRQIGALPARGQWVRLEVSAYDLGLEGKTLSGIAFTLYDGRATWDHAGIRHRDGELWPSDWEWNWDRFIPLYNPDLISTLPPGYYVNQDDMLQTTHPEYYYLIPPKSDSLTRGAWPGDLGTSWLNRLSTLSIAHTPPPGWNPRSMGFVDIFDGTSAAGWAYDPWSTTTRLSVFVTGSPNGCYMGPANIGDIYVTNPATPARDTGIRDYIKTTANYIPPEDMKFEFSVNLVNLLRSKGVVCRPGNYQVQIQVQDEQGDGLTGLLTYGGASTLTVPATP